MAEVLPFGNKTLFNYKAKVRLEQFYFHALTNALDVSGKYPCLFRRSRNDNFLNIVENLITDMISQRQNEYDTFIKWFKENHPEMYVKYGRNIGVPFTDGEGVSVNNFFKLSDEEYNNLYKIAQSYYKNNSTE